jgi:hypothetical protein
MSHAPCDTMHVTRGHAARLMLWARSSPHAMGTQLASCYGHAARLMLWARSSPHAMGTQLASCYGHAARLMLWTRSSPHAVDTPIAGSRRASSGAVWCSARRVHETKQLRVVCMLWRRFARENREAATCCLYAVEARRESEERGSCVSFVFETSASRLPYHSAVLSCVRCATSPRRTRAVQARLACHV